MPRVTDVTGRTVYVSSASDASPLPPVIKSITGEAVDKGIIYPGLYGSPDLLSDGLYWSATINPNCLGVFAYTMHLELHYLKLLQRGHDAMWGVVQLDYSARINVTQSPLKNGFAYTPTLTPIFMPAQ